MRILFFGDIVGKIGRHAVNESINKLVEKYHIDFVIANGENVTHGKGLIEKHYYELLNMGINAITLGNHYNSKKNITDYIEDAEYLIRPLNLIERIGGEGSRLFTVNGINIRVTNILGAAFMKEEVTNPYGSIVELLEEIKDENSIHIIDFHAEATGEKMAFAYALDGKVSAVLGTHTHVQTNDARVLPNGTAFISDIGMCGAHNGILGFEKESVIRKTLYGENSIFTIDDKDQKMVNAVVMDFDEQTKKCREIFIVKMVN